MHLCAVVGPLLPPPLARPCPLWLTCFAFLFLFLFGRRSCRAHRCSRAPCVCPLLLCALPLSRRPVPSPPVSPFLPSYLLLLCGSCLYVSVRPHCLCCALTRVCHPCVLPLPLSAVHNPSPWWLTYPCGLPSFPDFCPFRDALGSRRGGGFTCGLNCGPARGRVRPWIVRIRRL